MGSLNGRADTRFLAAEQMAAMAEGVALAKDGDSQHSPTSHRVVSAEEMGYWLPDLPGQDTAIEWDDTLGEGWHEDVKALFLKRAEAGIGYFQQDDVGEVMMSCWWEWEAGRCMAAGDAAGARRATMSVRDLKKNLMAGVAERVRYISRTRGAAHFKMLDAPNTPQDAVWQADREELAAALEGYD